MRIKNNRVFLEHADINEKDLRADLRRILQEIRRSGAGTFELYGIVDRENAYGDALPLIRPLNIAAKCKQLPESYTSHVDVGAEVVKFLLLAMNTVGGYLAPIPCRLVGRQIFLIARPAVHTSSELPTAFTREASRGELFGELLASNYYDADTFDALVERLDQEQEQEEEKEATA